MKKKKDFTIDDLAVMTAQGFGEVDNKFSEMRKEMNEGFSLLTKEIVGLKSDVGDLKSDVGTLKKDMVWVKDILENHTGFLRRLDEERIFTLSYVNRLEKEIEFVKKRLKIA